VGKFPGISKGAVLKEGINEIGEGMWESQVKVSDEIVRDAIVTRGGGIIQVSNNIVDFCEGNWFICRLEVGVLFDEGRS
jgi:hypothetical protein